MAPHITSRCAPASEPPTTVRGSCHTLARSSQSASDSGMGGRSPVRRSSADDDLDQRVEGVLSTLVRHVTDGAALVGGVGRAEGLLDAQRSPVGQRPDDPGLLGVGVVVEPAALARGRPVVAMRSGTGRANSSRQPGRPSRMAPCSNESRIFIVCGQRQRHECGAALGGEVRRRQLVFEPVGVERRDARGRSSWPGRLARSDSVAMRSISSSLNPLRHPGTISSSVVPGWSRDRRAQCLELGARRSSATAPVGRPRRCGCGPARWRSPRAPSSSDRCSRATMAASCRRGGLGPDRLVPHGGAAQGRVAHQEPGVHADARRRSARASPRTTVHVQSRCSRAASGMPSTRAIIRAR